MRLLGTPAGDGLFCQAGGGRVVAGQGPGDPLEDTDLRFVFVADGTFQQDEIAHLIRERASKTEVIHSGSPPRNRADTVRDVPCQSLPVDRGGVRIKMAYDV